MERALVARESGTGQGGPLVEGTLGEGVLSLYGMNCL